MKLVASEKVLFALVSTFVLIAFISSNMNGYAVASSCSGTPVLELVPNPVQVGEPIAAKVSGLSNCFGAEVQIKEGSSTCGGAVITSYSCRGINCDGYAVFTVNTAKDYVIAACIDKNGDGYFLSQNEKSSAILKATSLPDLSVDGIKFEPTIAYAGEPIITAVTVSNKGVATVTGFTISLDLYKEGRPESFYRYDNQQDRLSVSETLEILQKGESAALRLPAVSLAAGKYRAKVAVDYNDKFLEIDEKNNIFETTLEVF